MVFHEFRGLKFQNFSWFYSKYANAGRFRSFARPLRLFVFAGAKNFPQGGGGAKKTAKTETRATSIAKFLMRRASIILYYYCWA